MSRKAAFLATRAAKIVRARKSRGGRFLAGLGALAAIWPAAQPARYPHRSHFEALRSDAMRIGDDMRRVIERERESLQAGSK